MNIAVLLDGQDVTSRTVLNETRINYDSSRRISTATVTLRWTAPGTGSYYDEAIYDEDVYSFEIRDLALLTIVDGRDGVTKLFEGTVSALDLKQTDMKHPDETAYVCTANDYAVWLDRAVTQGYWPIVFPVSDQQLIRDLIGEFCTRIHAGANVTALVPVIQSYDYAGKTCRQLLDDMAALSGGSWRVDFDGELFYGAFAQAAAAPFDLSTDPDYVTSFPVRVDGWKRDFTNPINTCYVRGALNADGSFTNAYYIDPVSVSQFGPLEYTISDDQITDTTVAELRAKTTVLQYAEPLEQGSFTIWKDGLALGQKVNITEGTLAVDGTFVIRSLAMSWLDAEQVVYTANFGALKPDLESYLRILDQRTRWLTSVVSPAPPINGSVSDASIVEGGLSAISIGEINADQINGKIQAEQIETINATQIEGKIESTQIDTINAGQINGSITADQIDKVYATDINGYIQAGQIGSVNATTIKGVIVSDQVADGIIDSLSKFAAQLAPIQIIATFPGTLPDDNFPPNSYFYSNSGAQFYRMSADGTTYVAAGSNPDTLTGKMQVYSVGKLSAQDINGLIIAGQIDKINADQINGKIQANQIAGITAGQISGSITADQIDKVYASDIDGYIQANQIGSIDASKITVGYIQGSQIQSINAQTITINQITDGQIANINGSKLTVGTVNSDKLNANSIDCGGGGGKPGVINTYDGAGAVVARMGLLTTSDYGIWAKVFGAGGTSYADAVVRTDTAGNLTINNATIDIEHTPSNTYLTTGPNVFDGTYQSMGLLVGSHSTGDNARVISRGLVCYYGATMVAAIVRSPTTPTAGAVQLNNGILLDGADGSVAGKVFRSTVDSRSGVSGNYTAADGTQFIFSGGIVTYYAQPAATGLTTQINIPVPIKGQVSTQYYECYFTNGILVSSTIKPL